MYDSAEHIVSYVKVDSRTHILGTRCNEIIKLDLDGDKRTTYLYDSANYGELVLATHAYGKELIVTSQGNILVLEGNNWNIVHSGPQSIVLAHVKIFELKAMFILIGSCGHMYYIQLNPQSWEFIERPAFFLSKEARFGSTIINNLAFDGTFIYATTITGYILRINMNALESRWKFEMDTTYICITAISTEQQKIFEVPVDMLNLSHNQFFAVKALCVLQNCIVYLLANGHLYALRVGPAGKLTDTVFLDLAEDIHSIVTNENEYESNRMTVLTRDGQLLHFDNADVCSISKPAVIYGKGDVLLHPKLLDTEKKIYLDTKAYAVIYE